MALGQGEGPPAPGSSAHGVRESGDAPERRGETTPGNGACEPFDGYVVVAVFVDAEAWEG